MWIYLMTFLTTLVFSYQNEVNLKKRRPNKLTHYISAGMIILIPAGIAALRADSVGVDTLVYAKPIFTYSIYCSSYSEILSRFLDIEPLFLFLSFAISRISKSFQLFLFLISFIIQLVTYLALYRRRDQCSIFVGEALYLFYMYNQSFNMMRQSIAMAIMLLGMTYLFERRYIAYTLWLALGFFFHKSIIIGLVFIPLIVFIDEHNGVEKTNYLSQRKKILLWAKFAAITCGAFCVTVMFQTLIIWLGGIGVISERFTNYLNGESGTFNWKFFAVYILPLIWLFLNTSKIRMGYTFLSIEVINILLFGMQYTIYYLYRISVYFMAVRLFSMSEYRIDLYRIVKTGKIRYTEILSLTSIAFGFIYWFSFIIINNNHGTADYVFFFQ